MNTSTVKTVSGWVVAGVVAIVVLIVFGVVAWQLSWFVSDKNADRQTNQDNHRSGTQSAWQQKVVSDMKDAVLLKPGPQRAAIVDEACLLASKLTPTYETDEIATFVAGNC